MVWQNHNYAPSVDSLTPTFQWEKPGDSTALYDFVIFTAVKEGYLEDLLPGDQVYYQSGLTTTTHKVTTPLKPKTMYLWSVRTRRGELVSSWSSFTWKRGYKVLYDAPFVEGLSVLGRLFPFVTPAD
jgi:hypothetical protein